jgi:SAM-dependent methyltransferase
MQLTAEEAIAKVNRAKWYHSFEVLPGVVTPGKAPTDPVKLLNERFGLPKDLSGRRALDIGALDGPYSFELEKRGAEVVAVDIQHPDHTGFNTAKEVRGSKVQYFQASAYELTRVLTGKFDIVCFFGVYYHMKHPLLGFEQIHSLLADDGLLLLEGECLLNHAEDPEVPSSQPSAFIASMARSNIPITLFYPRTYKGDGSNWFVPNLACVRAWLDAAAMELVTHGEWNEYPYQRMFGTARKIKGRKIEPDNPVW